MELKENVNRHKLTKCTNFDEIEGNTKKVNL